MSEARKTNEGYEPAEEASLLSATVKDDTTAAVATADKGSKGKLIIAVSTISAAILVLFIACAVYLGIYYHADEDAIEAYTVSGIYESEDAEGNLLFAPEAPIAGFIFYPGGKVEHKAYVPLMRSIAENGILCVLIDMPFNLAIFDTGAADGIKDAFPSIERWYIGGHSLGGSMAASYAGKHAENFHGVVLLASYSSSDLSGSGMEVLSVYGSEDKVMNLERYEDNKENLPDDFEEYVIDGGCHAYFGTYGEQKGDGVPTISQKEQIAQTALIVSLFIAT